MIQEISLEHSAAAEGVADAPHREHKISAPKIRPLLAYHADRSELRAQSRPGPPERLTVERKNGTLRQWYKRLTRLTYAFSKKWDNTQAKEAL